MLPLYPRGNLERNQYVCGYHARHNFNHIKIYAQLHLKIRNPGKCGQLLTINRGGGGRQDARETGREVEAGWKVEEGRLVTDGRTEGRKYNEGRAEGKERTDGEERSEGRWWKDGEKWTKESD